MGRSSRVKDQVAYPRLTDVPFDRLVVAKWNYKKPGTPEETERLAASIRHDRSYGVLPVREVEGGMFEVMDGNHRHAAIALLVSQDASWSPVQVENFGPITIAQAVTIARRRNYQWFEDDIAKLAILYRDLVLPETAEDVLRDIMPEGIAGIRNLVDALSFDWQDDPARPSQGLSLPMNDRRRYLWSLWSTHCRESWAITSPGDLFTRVLLTALRAVLPEQDASALDEGEEVSTA